MASVANDHGGRRRIIFELPDGRRPSLRLGKCAKAAAQTVAGHVGALAQARQLGAALPQATVEWLTGISDDLHGKLAAVGLVQPRQTATLGEWLARFIEAKRPELQPNSVRSLVKAQTVLVRHFGADTRLTAITPERAAKWRRWLAEQRTDAGEPLSLATVRTYTATVKTMIGAAVAGGLLASNPSYEAGSVKRRSG